MSQAEIVPIGTRGRPGRGTQQRTTPSSAARSLAGGSPGRKTRAAANPATSPAAPEPTESAPTKPAPARATKPAPARATKPAPTKPAPTKPAAARGPTASADAPPADPAAALAEALQVDLPPAVTELLGLVGDAAYAVWGPSADEVVAEGLAFLRRRLTGAYEIDEFGLDRDLTESVILPLLRPLYEKWFRIEVIGAENIPVEGGALVVANHSGTIAVDAVMTGVAVHKETPDHRILRMLGADFVFSLPFVSQMSRKTGSTLACAEDGHRLLTKGELVGVWPEGFKGIGKPYSERYRLQRFGRGGYVSSAITAGVPIIPTAIVGAEEIYPIIGNMPTLARLVGAPYFPVTPLFPWLGPLGLVPLPSKWLIEFGEPIPTDHLGAAVAEDPMAVFNLGDQVRETIQSSLYQLLQRRRSIFF
jgi:1-acyl-sn-glycerol-3-phosphate acyltransferase